MVTKFFVVITKVNETPNTTSNIINTNSIDTTTPKLPSPTQSSSVILLAGGWSDRDVSTVEIISDETCPKRILGNSAQPVV